MTLRKPYTISAHEVDTNFSRLYENKIESRYKYYGSSTSQATAQVFVKPYQHIETGEALFSANGSAATVRTFPLQERPSTIITAIAHAYDAAFLATVTDVTQCQITIACTAWSQTAGRGFSLTTTGTVRVFWQVLGSS